MKVITPTRVSLAASVRKLSSCKYSVCWICKCEECHLSQRSGLENLDLTRWEEAHPLRSWQPSSAAVCLGGQVERAQELMCPWQLGRQIRDRPTQVPARLWAFIHLTSQSLEIKSKCPSPTGHFSPFRPPQKMLPPAACIACPQLAMDLLWG